jgi:hypothetical protein
MLVSAFEIRRHDRERQHYRLSVTNLKDRDFEYSVEFHGEQSSGSASSFSGTTTLAFTVDERRCGGCSGLLTSTTRLRACAKVTSVYYPASPDSLVGVVRARSK